MSKWESMKSDKTVANLITDGCNMGIKSLNKYLNQYAMADVISKKITRKTDSIRGKSTKRTFHISLIMMFEKIFLQIYMPKFTVYFISTTSFSYARIPKSL